MLKRLFDIVVSALALLVLWPLLLVLCLVSWVKLGRPVFFRQERPGLHGKVFRLIKLRTMSDARGPDGELLPDEQRLGRYGRFLRSTSLDELPELINILRGEMSLVGPRPLLVRYLPRYSPEQARRHDVRPGLTGWAQVKGRNAVSWPERFKLDVWYVDHRSFWLDLKIIAMTVEAVLCRRGISAEGEATMSEFMGNEPQMDERDGR
ncbi:MAG: sugar transferase [Verrucomicrobiota bacterium JB024]|nr:sugar transferase [Verrucomicrobiota bacterium JB024]